MNEKIEIPVWVLAIILVSTLFGGIQFALHEADTCIREQTAAIFTAGPEPFSCKVVDTLEW